MRTDPVLPKAVVVRVHGGDGDRYLLFKWALDPRQRRLMNVVDSLERADRLVLYDNRTPEGYWSGPPNSGIDYTESVTPAQRLQERDRQLGIVRERGH
jgi:hypothetical protein